MPLYDYACAACGRRFEVIHGVHDEGPATCPLCGEGPVRKAITAASVHYKGSGWAKKERRAAVKTAASSGGGEDGGSEKGSPASESDAAKESEPSSDRSDATPPLADDACAQRGIEGFAIATETGLVERRSALEDPRAGRRLTDALRRGLDHVVRGAGHPGPPRTSTSRHRQSAAGRASAGSRASSWAVDAMFAAVRSGR